MLSMGKDGTTVVDMVTDWLEENGYDGMTDGRCFCTGGCLMHCGAPVPLHAMHPPDHLRPHHGC